MKNELEGKEWDKCRHTYLLKCLSSIGLSDIELSGREILKELSFKANKQKTLFNQKTIKKIRIMIQLYVKV